EPDPDVIAALVETRDQRLLDWIETRGSALSDPLSIVVQFFNPTDVVLSGIFPRPILAGLVDHIDMTRYDTPGRLPMTKPQLRLARHVGPSSLAATAGSTSLFGAVVAGG
ncbi:MAG: hypothetical protein AAFR53_10235, partial [Pseudomonadota bacterium]